MNRRQRRAAARQGQPGRAPAPALDADRALERGMAYYESGRHDEAERVYRDVVAGNPRQSDALHMLGVLAHLAGRHELAVAYLAQAIDVDPTAPGFHHNLGEALRALGRIDEALEQYALAVELHPTYAVAHNGLGVALERLGMHGEAMQHFELAAALEPGLAMAHANLGVTLESAGRPGEAVACYERALELAPASAEVLTNLGSALQKLGVPDEAEARFREAIALRPDFSLAHSNLLLCLLYTDRDPAETFAEHGRWVQHHARSVGAAPPRTIDGDPERRLHVGYVGADLGSSPVAHFLEPLLRAHDRAQVEVTCYAAAAGGRLDRLADRWRDVARLPDAELAELVADDGIDILVDLVGHTGGHRLLTFARRAAPVQVAYCGYPATTGLDSIDYRLTDSRADPEGTTGALHSEQLVRLPGGFLCYAPPADAPEPAPLPSFAAAHVTFGSFNHLPKLVPQVVALWARVLHAVPGSRLLLKAMGFAEPEACERLRSAFASHGIEAERVELIASTSTHEEHLDLYARVDVALDPFPYNGATTTCEALWMGLPVVTLADRVHAGRVGVSLMHAAGLDDFVAADGDEYVEIARRLAGDPAGLAQRRSEQRDRVAASPPCDGRDRAARSSRRTATCGVATWRARPRSGAGRRRRCRSWIRSARRSANRSSDTSRTRSRSRSSPASPASR